MNRKLQRTTTALSATAVVFTGLLLAGGPVRPSSPSALVLTADTAADTLDSALTTPVPEVSARERRHLRHSRALLAFPYFSFAQGLRRNRS